MGNMTVLPSKDPTEVCNIYVDMSSLLQSGEAVGSALVTVTLLLGDVALDVLTVDGAATVFQNVVTQQLSGGTIGNIYCVRIAGTTNQGNVLISLVKISIVGDDPYGS